MKKLYLAPNPLVAEVLVQLLEQEGIEAVVQGEDVYTVFGGPPFTYPWVWIADEADLERAEKVVDDFEYKEIGRPRTWRCPGCGQEHEKQFSVCWKCGTERPTVEGARRPEQEDIDET